MQAAAVRSSQNKSHSSHSVLERHFELVQDLGFPVLALRMQLRALPSTPALHTRFYKMKE